MKSTSFQALVVGALCLCTSGLAAVAYAFLPFVAPGDHVLIPANVYDPVKTLANGLLKRMNVTVEQYDPLVEAGVSGFLVERPEDRGQAAEQMAEGFRELAAAIAGRRLDPQAIRAKVRP